MRQRKVIALLMNSEGLRDDYQGGLRRGVELACAERDVDLWVFASRADAHARDQTLEHLLGLIDPEHIDGVVVAAGCIASTSEAWRTTASLRRQGVTHLCSIGQSCADIPAVLVDNQRGTMRLVEHLVEEHNRRRFLYLGGPQGHEEAEQRRSGFLAALERHGIQLDPSAFLYGDWSVAFGTDAMQEQIRKKVGFDAVVAANDDTALGALAVLRAVGIRCPEDVSVVGFDDAASARFCHPPLTTVSQPLVRLGGLGVNKVIQSWDGQIAPESSMLDTELVLRESCGCHPTNLLRSTTASRRRGRVRRTPLDEIRELLRPIFDSTNQRERWSGELIEAAAAEMKGRTGTLGRVLNSLILRIPNPHVPLYELQRIVTCLRDAAVDNGLTQSVEEAFHAARVLVGSHSYRREGEKHLRNEYLLAELRLSWERLATSLSLPSLRRVLASELPHFGILNAVVSLYDQGDPRTLVPLVCVRNGVRCDLPEIPYRTSNMLPPDAFDSDRRRSLTVLPLTFEFQQLGIAVLELPQGLDVYSLLREQIGSAIKTALLHQEMLAKERLNALVQEEKRVTAERLRSLSLVAGGVAHDLNNALGPLVALPETIQKDLESCFGNSVPKEVSEDLETIRQAGQRAALTIRDLLALGRPSEEPQGAIEFGAFIKQEKPALTALLEQDPRVELIVEHPLPGLVVAISKQHLSRALTNLIINAADAIANHGAITVRARHLLVETTIEGIEPVEPGDYVVIEVEDTGTGIPTERLSRVLEPFFSVKQRPGSSGTGLGLAIVHRIVKDAYGHLHVESTLGKGTKFGIYLPYQTDVDCPKSARPEPIVGGKERILVIDDEVVQLRTARRILEQLGYEVTTVSSGGEAIEMCQALPQGIAYDLVIVDMVMPGQFDGIRTVDELRRLRPEQRVLVASGFAPEQMDVSASDRGLPWLAKPYSRAKLAGVVRATLDGIRVSESRVP